MAMRLCKVCRSAENPLGRLRFKKHLDGEVYCEICLPVNMGLDEPSSPVATLSSPAKASAGFAPGDQNPVVIPCPECRGMSPKPHGKMCKCCSDYGSVRIPINFLNVYRPTANKPEILTEG